MFYCKGWQFLTDKLFLKKSVCVGVSMLIQGMMIF